MKIIMQLAGKIALVTGGTTGIGFAAARQFLEEGAKAVIITGQDVARLESAERDLSTYGTVRTVRYRAEETGDVEAVKSFVESEFGHVDIVFANAAVAWPSPFGEIDPFQVQQQLAINVTAPLCLVQALAPLMPNGGSVVLTTSCLNVLGASGMAVYAASKAALRSLARSLSVDLKAQGIRLNAVSPGPTETPIYGKFGMDAAQIEEMSAGLRQTVPAGRFAQPDEVAAVATFLASDASRYMLGEEINVDGGWANL